MNGNQTKEGIMAIIDTRGDYATAYGLYLTLQGECAHWDYENPDGVGVACCNDMQRAKENCQRIKKRLSK